jgi:glycine oxidase
VLNAAFISTKYFLEDALIWLKNTNRLRVEKVDYDSIDLSNTSYKGTKYREIIFCEGYHGLENPWFNYLPLQATKGETLTITSNEITRNASLNRKCFVLPIERNEFKVGATYSWDNPTLNLTEEAKEELITQLQQLTTGNFEVIDQEAGVRPTVLDRRPLLGRHPIHTSLIIFNGLGTKGYLMAPLLAKELVDSLFNKKELDKEIHIQRYQKRLH